MANDEEPTPGSTSWNNDGEGEIRRDGQIPLHPYSLRETEFATDEIDELELLSIPAVKYRDGDSIDWINEEARERARQLEMKSQYGLKRLSLLVWNTTRLWLTLLSLYFLATPVFLIYSCAELSLVTGIGVGVIGGWLDVLVAWLNDLRDGRCVYGFFYNQLSCCSGLQPGEVCQFWMTWGQWFGLRYIFLQSFLQTTIYVVSAVVFASSAGILVKSYAPYAFHTGIPEIKAIVGGYVLDEFLGPWTLIIKGFGLALSVASGLSLGKEGPLIHVSCAMAAVVSRYFGPTRQTESEKRKLLAAAAAAGVSVAFGSPLGGVLFGLEELNTFTDELVVSRAFVTSVVAAVALQYVDPFGTSKLVLFQVTAIKENWKAFELLPWLFLGVLGGIFGAFLIRLNILIAVYRRNSVISDWPLMEIVAASATTAVFSYLVIFARVQTSDLVANLFLECDPLKGDWHGLCNPDAYAQNIFLLLLTAILKFGLTAYTFGMKVPAGIFLPTIAIGACLGRATGLLVAYPTLWIFSACPPDLGTRCISPGFYAVIGASALLGGVTRMTISLVVILFELTGALSHVLPIMLAVMVSKWVGDAFGKEGIYDAWIAMRAYSWLSSIEHRDYGATAASIMTSKDNLVVINGVDMTVKELDSLVRAHNYFGFPVVDGDNLIGFVTHERLRMALASYVAQEELDVHCTFLRGDRRNIGVNMASLMETAPMEFRSEMAQELLVSIFQRLNLRYALFSRKGKLTGLITKRDVVRLLTRHYRNTPAGALTRDGKPTDHEWDVDW